MASIYADNGLFQELRKIGFCDYQNVFSRNEKKVHFKVPPVWPKNSHNNIGSAKMKFSRNEETGLWILHNNNSIWFPCLTIDVKILRSSSIFQSFLDSSLAFLYSSRAKYFCGFFTIIIYGRYRV